ncbi:MAG: hypothetical protein WCC60_13530 [Ilumatobacteraceae bacterium]
MLALVACSGGGDGDGTALGSSTTTATSTTATSTTATTSAGATTTAPAEPAATATDITTVEQLQAALAADHSTDAWYTTVTGITLETHLGASILVLQVSWDNMATDFDTRSALLDPAKNAIDSYDTVMAVNIATRDVNGAFNAAGGGGSEIGLLGDVVALPPAPTTPEEMSAWLTTVFGPGGLVPLGPQETWYSSITSIAMEDVGNGPELTIATTLGQADKTELASLFAAVQLTASPLLTTWAVRGAGGYYSANGGSGCGPTPGSCGWYYPLTA